jgi:enoyl-CoA hydratase/carnithine racemase
MNSYSTLLFSLENSVATITLNRPTSANSMDMAMGKELLAVAQTL